jgi:pimeloyl-ACP methyl ester carboxylesterase
MVEHSDLSACDQFDVMERIKEIDLPSLVIVGQDDVMTPVRYAEYLGRELKNAEVVVVPNSGHFVTLEQPEAVNAAVAQFLERLDN